MTVQRLTDLSGIADPPPAEHIQTPGHTVRAAPGRERVPETEPKYNPPVDQPYGSVSQTTGTAHASPLEIEEFRQLRATVRQRGSLRVVLFVVTMAVWSLVAGLVGTFVSLPLASLVPLLVLVAGFEAVHQLHIGVERIGRYLYVRYESNAPGHRLLWEGAVASFGAGHRTATRPADGLFSLVFTIAVIANFLVGALGATMEEMIGVGAIHALAIARVWMARRAASTQRADDQTRFEAVLK